MAMARCAYWDPKTKTFVDAGEVYEFDVHDVVRHVESGDVFVVEKIERSGLLATAGGRRKFGKLGCELAYSPDTGVMDAFAADKNTGLMLELAQEQGKYVCVAGSSVFIDGNEDRCHDRLSSGTLHPESALRLLQKRSNYGREFTKDAYRMSPAALEHFSKPDVQAWMRERVKERPLAKFYCEPSIPDTVAFDDVAFVYATWANWLANADDTRWPDAMKRGCAYADKTGAPLATVTTAKQYQELFGKPAPVGMFGPATMAFDGGVLTVVHQGTSVNVLTGRDLDIECQKRFDLYREIGESDDAFRERCLSSLRSPGSFKAHLEKPHSEYTALASPKTPASNNCASCGDVLHETYDPSRIVDGQRHHGTCADRVERLKAEQAPKVVDDPYTQHRLSRNEELNRAAMDLLDDGFVSSFRADKEPESKAGSFVHPWTCDESEP